MTANTKVNTLPIVTPRVAIWKRHKGRRRRRTRGEKRVLNVPLLNLRSKSER